MIADDLLRKLKNKQAELIKKSTSSVSFSQVLNDSLRDYLAKKSK